MRQVGKLAGDLDLSALTFGYNRSEPPLLMDFSAHLAPGARVALVGASGCGKSTVARLIMGLHDPWSGQIRFDGVQRADVAPDRWMRSVAMVEQRTALFDGTIMDNLTLWNSTLAFERIEAAARDACIHEVIMKLPRGYRTEISGGGGDLSGGERQRLEIARALAQDPSILILDEASSALDPETEDRVNDNIRRRGVTCLIIAHRLSAVRDCDEILAMERGAVVERGAHADLLAKLGLYHRLVTAA